MLRFLTFLSILFSLQVSAHPVIYKGGWVISSFNMDNMNDQQLMYSFTSRFATGLNSYRFTKDEQDTDLLFAKLNYLAWRYNGDKSQANLYLHSGVGFSDQQSVSQGALMYGAEMDWETRELFVGFKHWQYYAPHQFDMPVSMARVGFSPFTAPFDSLQSWFMVQAMYAPLASETISLTPMLRFFYKNVLWEMGASSKGGWMLNLMVHY